MTIGARKEALEMLQELCTETSNEITSLLREFENKKRIDHFANMEFRVKATEHLEEIPTILESMVAIILFYEKKMEKIRVVLDERGVEAEGDGNES